MKRRIFFSCFAPFSPFPLISSFPSLPRFFLLMFPFVLFSSPPPLFCSLFAPFFSRPRPFSSIPALFLHLLSPPLFLLEKGAGEREGKIPPVFLPPLFASFLVPVFPLLPPLLILFFAPFLLFLHLFILCSLCFSFFPRL